MSHAAAKLADRGVANISDKTHANKLYGLKF